MHILKNYQELSRESKCVIFPNAKYEIENNFITPDGLAHIVNPFRDYKGVGLPTTPLPKSYLKNKKYNVEINTELENLELFSLWSLKRKDENDKIKGGKFKWVFFKGLTYSAFCNIIKDSNRILNQVRWKIEKGKAAKGVEFENRFFWCTKYDQIKPIQSNLAQIIYKLGLNHYCNYLQPDFVCGMVFKVVNDKIYKPNFTCQPSNIAYCGLPYTEGQLWGSTTDLTNYNKGVFEAVIPIKHFRFNKISVKKIILYKSLDKRSINTSAIVSSIHNRLSYNKMINYDVSTDGKNVSFSEI